MAFLEQKINTINTLPGIKNNTFGRRLWQWRYRIYAFLVLLILLPVLYASGENIPQSVEALNYDVVNTNFLADKIVRREIRISPNTNLASNVQNNSLNEVTTDSVSAEDDKYAKLDSIYQKELEDVDFDLGNISSKSFVELGIIPEISSTIEIDGKPLGPTSGSDETTSKSSSEQSLQSAEEVVRPQTLDDLIPRPSNPQRVNFLRYPKYNINAPIIYTSFEDLFAQKENCNPDTDPVRCINFKEARDTSSPDSPVQKKLEEGTVHLAFSPPPGESGNSYIVGHSSNYSWIQSNYNTIFKPIKEQSQPGEEFFVYDVYGRELKFCVFEALKIAEEDTDQAYKTYGDRRVVTLQTSILGRDATGAIAPTHRWLTRGELQLDPSASCKI